MKLRFVWEQGFKDIPPFWQLQDRVLTHEQWQKINKKYWPWAEPDQYKKLTALLNDLCRGKI